MPELRVSPTERLVDLSLHAKTRVLPSRYRQQTLLRRLASQIGTAAVQGFGFALGRDVYRATKTLFRLVSSLAILFLWALLPLLAGYFLTRRRGASEVAAGVLAASVGYFACFVLCGMLASIWAPIATMEMPAAPTAIFLAIAVFLPSYLVGARAGKRAHDQDEAVATVVDHNHAFLDRHGIRETGGRDITHYDGQGNPLRFVETHHHQMLFMVVGRRGRRASISLEPDGRMVAYSGA